MEMPKIKKPKRENGEAMDFEEWCESSIKACSFGGSFSTSTPFRVGGIIRWNQTIPLNL